MNRREQSILMLPELLQACLPSVSHSLQRGGPRFKENAGSILLDGGSYEELLLSHLPNTRNYIAKLRVVFTSIRKSKYKVKTISKNILLIAIVVLLSLSVASTVLTLKVEYITIMCQD